jgi:hypothetical protein
MDNDLFDSAHDLEAAHIAEGVAAGRTCAGGAWLLLFSVLIHLKVLMYFCRASTQL